MYDTSLAYLLVALCHLLPEAEYHARQLNLPCPSLLERTNLAEFAILGGRERLSGYLATTNYIFHFKEWGQLDYLEQRRPTGADARIREEFDRLAQQHSDVNPKEAYQVATQWLEAIDVDVPALERKFQHRVDYPKTDNPVKVESTNGMSRRTRIVPRFTVTWGAPGNPHLEKWMAYAAQATVLGPSKSVARIAIEDMALSKRPRIEIPGAPVLHELPNEPFTNLWTSRELSVTNVFGLLRTSTAYQSVMLRRMLDEANWTLRQLGLPSEAQLSASDLKESFIVPPVFGFRGCLRGKDSFFKFDKQGKLVYAFYTPPRRPGQNLDDHYEEMSRRPMLVDSNSVVTLATGWLKAVQVDVEAINKITKPVVTRYIFTNRKGRKQPSHIWWISWWDHAAGKPIASVQIDGTSRNPDRIETFDIAYIRREGIGVSNAEALMAVPDRRPQRDPLQPHLNVTAD